MNARSKIPEMIQGLALLEGLDSQLYERMAAEASIQKVPRGATVFRQGDPSTGLHVVIMGQVKLLMNTGNGHEKVIEVLGPNAAFGEAALFLGHPHSVTAEAVMDTELVHLTREALLREVMTDGNFALRVITNLARRFNRRTEDLRNYMLFSGTQRVVCFLLREIPDECEETVVDVTLSTRKGVIASKLNLTQEHFSRILRDLGAAALIEVSGARIRIPDVPRLRACLTG